MESPLPSASPPARNSLAGLPAEIVMLIIDCLDPQDMYRLLFAEPMYRLVRSSSGWRMLPMHRRIREICISHNVKFGAMSTLTCAINNHDATTVRQVLREATAIAEASPGRPKVISYAPRHLWHRWLLSAVRKCNMGIVGAMLLVDDMKAYLNEDRFIDDLLFEAAAENGDTDLMALLFENGADAHAADPQAFTPLLLAASSNNMDAVRMLVTQHKVDCARRDYYRSSALHYAVQNGNFDMARLLLENGAQTDVEDMAGYSPLSIAAEQGAVEILKLLLRHGADPNFAEFAVLGPLALAAQNGREEVARILLRDTAADVNSPGALGCTPLMEAICNRHPDTARVFIECPLLDPNARNSLDETALHLALRHDPTLQTAKLLLAVDGLRVDEPDDGGMTPLMVVLLHLYTSCHRARLTKWLLATGQVDLNASDSEGKSVLQYAIRTRDARVVRLLLDTGEIIVTPADTSFACRLGYWEIHDMLLRAADTGLVNGVQNRVGTEMLWHPTY
ncbi:ankyrin repeat [Trichoderma cornu-damae]|uniref:Ankyrin repeat n=1 Tax=Trichoderma cornu-damae TaxID=654480 RepID=A0A9P8TU55_9HYPO|nr:ankyrin repeat [Trichoderma cornu-damae]